jgi:hypothetical protein
VVHQFEKSTDALLFALPNGIRFRKGHRSQLSKGKQEKIPRNFTGKKRNTKLCDGDVILSTTTTTRQHNLKGLSLSRRLFFSF